MNIAYAHGGEHAVELAQASLLWDWRVDVAFLLPVLLAWCYVRGYRRYRRLGGSRFPAWRLWALLAGVAVIGVALLGPIDALADVSFAFHMIQHQLLMMIGVPLILLSAPFVPVIRGLPGVIRRELFIPFARAPVVRAILIFLTRPLVSFAAFQSTVVLWHMPYLYDAALFNPLIHFGEHFSFVAVAALLWWNVVRPYPFAPTNYLLRMVQLFASSIPNNVLGAMIAFADHPLYGYRFRNGFWGLSTLQDQQLGGLLMWVMGGMMFMLAITAVFIVYAFEEARKEPGFVLPGQARGLARPA